MRPSGHAARALATWLCLLAAGCRKTPRADAPHARPSATPSDASARREPPAFALRSLQHAPFSAVGLWAPPPGTPGAFTTVLLLHGNQGAPPRPDWMTDLRAQPAFARRILIAPALAGGDYEWGRPATARALGELLAEVAHEYPVDRNAVVLVGYSAGASRVLAVAAHMRGRLAGAAAVAGDVLRPVRLDRLALAPLRPLPLLLLCMTDDDGPNTSCALNARNLAALRREPWVDVALERLPGRHALSFAELAPRLDAWMSRVLHR